ncbi:MAG TPA: hypothetical protein VE871_14635 [Longimicrobium sp.]|nr:hypothetical protein [Longimicrobium sp.]
MSAPDNIAFHAADPAGGSGVVVLLFRPDAEGRVRVREWSSANYTQPGREDILPVDEMRARVDEWARTGWTLTESPVRIGHWLAGRG